MRRWNRCSISTASSRDAELLQAIARVNRTAQRKSAACWSTTSGVGAHLQKALQAYAPEDAEDAIGVLASITDEVPKLRDRHARAVALFTQAGIETFDLVEDIEACVDLLSDDALRARFGVLLKQFLSTLDTVLPRPEALPFVADAKRLGLILKVARRRYRDDGLGDFDASLYGEKVRALLDEHVTALDIATKIPPVLGDRSGLPRQGQGAHSPTRPRHPRWSTPSGSTSGRISMRIRPATPSSPSASTRS